MKAFLVIVALAVTVRLQSQQPTVAQDSTLNNLEHAAGYVTAPLGTLGNVLRVGSGPVDVVLIPGWGFGAGVFEQFMRENASRFHMVAVALPGFGNTAAPPMPPAGTSYGQATWIRGAEEAVTQLIQREGLRRPVVVGHFIVGSQVALRLALDHPDVVGGLVLVGAEPMCYMPSRRDSSGRTPMGREERVVGADTYMAPRWFKTVTKQTFDRNNFTRAQYSRDSARADALWHESATVPLPVMIRYLVEYGTMDLDEEFPRIKVPTRVLVPSFEPSMLADPKQAWLRTLYVDAWDSIARKNPLISVTRVANTRIFIFADEPEALRDAISYAGSHPTPVVFPAADSGQVSAWSYGESSHAVILGSNGCGAKESWDPQARALAAAGFRALAIDFRGHGQSRPGPQSKPPHDEYYSDVLGAVRYLRGTGANKVSIIGASCAGDAAAQASVLARKGEIDALVLLAHGGIRQPERMQGRKLFVIARDDANMSGPRLPKFRAQYERASDPKQLLILEGAAHAQRIFDTPQADSLLGVIMRFLARP